MNRYWLWVFPFLCAVGCAKTTATEQEQVATDSIIVAEDTVFSPRYVYEIPVPRNYERVVATDSTSFAYFLQHLPLKPQGTPVHYYDGTISDLTDVTYAVIDGYDLGTTDLQQCADWIIRLRAEWLYSQKRYNDIAFHFTNGWLCEYKRWAEGERVSVKGNHTSWYKAAAPDYSYKTFRQYLDMVFNYAGTLSLSKELKPAGGIQVGDVLIQGGSPGHAMIVVDVAKYTGNNGMGDAFIVAEGYMPAQDMHILINTPTNYNGEQKSPWEDPTPWFEIYSLLRTSGGYLSLPTWSFNRNDIKRFTN